MRYAKLVDREVVPVFPEELKAHTYNWPLFKPILWTDVGSYRVKTYFMGRCPSHVNPPRWFETVVAHSDDVELYEGHSATYKEALEVHEAAVEKARKQQTGRSCYRSGWWWFWQIVFLAGIGVIPVVMDLPYSVIVAFVIAFAARGLQEEAVSMAVGPTPQKRKV